MDEFKTFIHFWNNLPYYIPRKILAPSLELKKYDQQEYEF